ncbi:MAG: ABC transporter substrate-binding protein [Cyanobacteria bacterium P01_A01_bin.123]
MQLRAIDSMSFTTVQPGKLLIITSDFDARPMSYLDGEKRLGYEPAVARAVCDKLGLDPVWINHSIGDFYTELATGNYDVIWFNQAVTQEKRAWADFTRPYGRFDEAVLVLEESPIETPENLKGKRLGGLENLSNVELTQQFPDLELVTFSDSDNVLTTMLDALKQGEIDAIISDALMLLTAEAEDPALRVAFQLPTQMPFGVGVLPGNRELLEALNGALNTLIAEGTLAKLWAQWIPYKPCPFG